ncbi:UNVERIFIED_CONTAM: type II secretion system protein [Halobacillus marinus]
MKKWKRLLKNEKGFTLIELLAVIVILGIIALIAVPAIGNLLADTKDDAHDSNALALLEASRIADVNGDFTFPASANDLYTAGYLDAVPQDPKTGEDYTTAQVAKDGKEFKVTLKSGDTTYVNAKTKSNIKDEENSDD